MNVEVILLLSLSSLCSFFSSFVIICFEMNLNESEREELS